MMMLTWMLSSGLLSTGMRGVMLGSISPMWATSNMKPLASRPKVVMSCSVRVVSSATSMMSHASSNIVS